MRFKNQEGKVPFTVTPNEMYKKLLEMDTRLNTRRVLGWILQEFSEHKEKVDGEWEIPLEGFTPKTWISKDLGISKNEVAKSIKELVARDVLETEKEEKIFCPNGIYYPRYTTYTKLHDPSVWKLGKIKQIKGTRREIHSLS